MFFYYRMALSRRQKGYQGEHIVGAYFQSQGFELIQTNYQIRGGELDLVLKNESTWLFVEVKVVDGVDDLSDYITSIKLSTLKKTINSFFYEHEQGDLDVGLAVVCVKGNHIYQTYRHEA